MTALVDAVGTLHKPAGGAPRILSLVPSITELIVDLGLADRLVGRTHYCIHPADIVPSIPAIGGTKKINMAKARALAPTHAVVNIDENTREMVDELRQFVPHVIVTHPLAPIDNIALYALIGGVFGKAPEAAAMADRLRASMAVLRDAAGSLPPRRVIYLIWQDPWMTVSADTYIARALELINYRNQAPPGDARYPEVIFTPELIAGIDDILFSTEPFAFTATHLAAFAEAHPGAHGKLRLIDGEYTSWYGSRAVSAMDYLRRFAGL